MSAEFESLTRASIELGNRAAIMPIEELLLAAAFAELPNQSQVVSRLLSELFNNSNKHVRRIAVIACRRSRTFEVPCLKEALTDKLDDPEASVRYEAVCAIQQAGYDSSEIRNRLALIAENSTRQDQECVSKNPTNAELEAKVRARKLLDNLAAATSAT